MTVTLTAEHVYLGIIFILLAVQFFQWKSIYKLKDDIDQIWTQMAILVTTIAQQVEDVKKKINDAK